MATKENAVAVLKADHRKVEELFESFERARSEDRMVPLPMKAGDALIFTENLRHGGYPNVMERVRKTVHICFTPAWVGSQSPAHWNDDVFVTPEAWSRYTEEQRALLPRPSPSNDRHPEALSLKRLTAEMAELTRENAELKAALERSRNRSIFSRLFAR